MINVWIDDLTPCLKDNETGDFVQTEVVRIRRKSFLLKFNFEKYNEQLKTMPAPIMVSELPKVKLNLKGIRDYARNKGVSIASLSDEEKQLFITQ